MLTLTDSVELCYICSQRCRTRDDETNLRICSEECLVDLAEVREYTIIRANRSVCGKGLDCLKKHDCPIMHDTELQYRRMAEDPSNAEYYSLGIPDSTEHGSGDENRVFAYADGNLTGNDSSVVDGILGTTDPYEDHLNEPRDNFDGNPHYEVFEGKATAAALFTYYVEELMLTPDEIDEARAFHDTPEVTKLPHKDKWCSLWEPDCAGNPYNTKKGPKHMNKMWDIFNELRWFHDPGFKKEVDGKTTYEPRYRDKFGWLYIGRVEMDVVQRSSLIDGSLYEMVEKHTFFVSERPGKEGSDYKASLPDDWLASTIWKVSTDCAPGIQEWIDRLVTRGRNLDDFQRLTRPDYIRQLGEIAMRKLQKIDQQATA